MKIANIDFDAIDRLQSLIDMYPPSEDSYRGCAFYFLPTARKGGWYIKDEERLLLVARHPHRAEELIIFPEMSPLGGLRFKLTRDALTSDIFGRFRVSLGRFTLRHLDEFKSELGDLVTARQFIDPEMDWVYPLRVLSTDVVSRLEGIVFAKVRNKIRRTFQNIAKLVPVEHEIDAALNKVFSLWYDRIKSMSPLSYVEAGEYYHAFAKAINAGPEYIRGVIALGHDNEPVGITLWRAVSPTLANLYVNISDPNIVGLSDALLVEACRVAKASGIDAINLGGSEIESLDKFKKKYQPIQSLQLYSCTLIPQLPEKELNINWLDNLLQQISIPIEEIRMADVSTKSNELSQQAAQILMENLVIIEDFPKEGIRYLDFYRTFDESPKAKAAVVQCLSSRYKDVELDGVAAIGNGGFTLGACLAYELGLPMYPIRKAGDTVYNSYTSNVGMVYADRSLTLSKEIDLKGKNILLVDDTIATGGTFSGGIEVLTMAGANVVEIATVFETTSKKGRERVAPVGVYSIVAQEQF